MQTFVYLILIVFAVLQIILFFKIWLMTDDVKNMYSELMRIRKTVSPDASAIVPTKESAKEIESTDLPFIIGQQVVRVKDDSQFRIDSIVEGKNGEPMYYSEELDEAFSADELASVE